MVFLHLIKQSGFYYLNPLPISIQNTVPFCFQAYHHQPKVVSPSVFNAYFDLGLSCLFLFIVTLACFLHYPVTWPWLLYFVLAIGYHAAVIAVFVVQMTRPVR